MKHFRNKQKCERKPYLLKTITSHILEKALLAVTFGASFGCSLWSMQPKGEVWALDWNLYRGLVVSWELVIRDHSCDRLLMMLPAVWLAQWADAYPNCTSATAGLCKLLWCLMVFMGAWSFVLMVNGRPEECRHSSNQNL
ncbi:hypothetical protein AB4K20DRAFT_1982565 [Rhizopus microsporus]